MFNYRKILYVLFLLGSSYCSYSDDDIHIENHFIVVKDKNTSFVQRIDISSQNKSDLSTCTDANSFYCLKWGNYAKFKISKQDICNNFQYNSTLSTNLNVTFDIKNIHVYGGSERSTQKWPIEESSYSAFALVSSKVESQAIIEPLWFFSNGVYLHVDKETPLFISIDKKSNSFVILAKHQDPYLSPQSTSGTLLKYTICKLPNIKAAYLHAIDNVIQRPNAVLDALTIRKPIWSTWAKFKSNITEEVVGDYVKNIISHNFSISHVEIDDKWETCYGSLTVDTTRFPDMKTMISKFKRQKIQTTMWIHPFINLDCKPYHEEANKNKYFIRGESGVNTTWWNGNASYIDFSNPAAYNWFKSRLQALKNLTGVDSFKFDAGESDWAPDDPIYNTGYDNYPDTMLKYYVQLASSFGNMVEVRVGRYTQKYSVFVRMMDRQSSWDQPLGLASLIPTLLQMNVMGYPFVLPDMIGGNEYNGMVIDEELFVRWLQVSVFMPTLQFSIPPWDYGKNAINIAQKMVKIHNSFSNEIMQSMKQFVKKGTPVNPPLWWIDPNDTVTYTIDDQFMLGENILVAPVVKKGAKTRDIYLPKGIWRDENNKKGKYINGPIWLRKYKADLNTLPYFTKVKTESVSSDGHVLSVSILGLTSVLNLSLMLYYDVL